MGHVTPAARSWSAMVIACASVPELMTNLMRPDLHSCAADSMRGRNVPVSSCVPATNSSVPNKSSTEPAGTSAGEVAKRPQPADQTQALEPTKKAAKNTARSWSPFLIHCNMAEELSQ